ncbi:hypothetical protein [Candidatus Ichthyocystis sparus]|nr:hypothetical protein [Candidatus Ichthyocystis sparus]
MRELVESIYSALGGDMETGKVYYEREHGFWGFSQNIRQIKKQDGK